MRLIDPDALFAEINSHLNKPIDFKTCFGVELERFMVNAVPVVRCKDCIFGEHSPDGSATVCKFYTGLTLVKSHADFCSYGKARERNDEQCD